MDLGMSREEFVNDYFERKFFVKRGACVNHGVGWSNINDALYSWDAAEGTIQLFKNGKVPLEAYVEPFLDIGKQRFRIVKDIFDGYLRNGATLVLNRIDTKSQAINRIKMDIARFVGEKAAANGYVAFGGEGTFAKHWDTHDVFAVQLIGRKRWKVFEPTFLLPLPHQKSKEHKQECPTEPVFDGILEAGDVLYLPRGWWHEAIPLEGEETFHVAVGIHAAHALDYVVWSCVHVLSQHLELRRTLKFEENCQETIQDAVKVISEVLLLQNSIAAFKNAQLEQERVASSFFVEGCKTGKSKIIDDGSILTLNSVYRQNKSSEISANGFSLKVDEFSSRLVSGIFSGHEVAFGATIENLHPDYAAKASKLFSDLARSDVINIE